MDGSALLQIGCEAPGSPHRFITTRPNYPHFRGRSCPKAARNPGSKRHPRPNKQRSPARKAAVPQGTAPGPLLVVLGPWYYSSSALTPLLEQLRKDNPRPHPNTGTRATSPGLPSSSLRAPQCIPTLASPPRPRPEPSSGHCYSVPGIPSLVQASAGTCGCSRHLRWLPSILGLDGHCPHSRGGTAAEPQLCARPLPILPT